MRTPLFTHKPIDYKDPTIYRALFRFENVFNEKKIQVRERENRQKLFQMSLDIGQGSIRRSIFFFFKKGRKERHEGLKTRTLT